MSCETLNARSARRSRGGCRVDSLEVRLGVEFVQKLLNGNDVGIVRRISLEGVFEERAHTGARRLFRMTLVGLV